MAIQLKDVTYRRIAIMLSSALPIQGEDFTASVEANLQAIRKLKSHHRIALKMAYIFSRKVPREERQDLFQEIALTLIENGKADEKLAYAIARCDWRDFWKRYKIRQHYSLDSIVNDSDGNPATFGELLIGETEFELKMDGNLDAKRIWEMLPDKLKLIVQKRLLGQMVSPFDALDLQTWATKNIMYLA